MKKFFKKRLNMSESFANDVIKNWPFTNDTINQHKSFVNNLNRLPEIGESFQND